MRIGELARAAGVTTKTLRFYEGRGLLPAARRTASGYRDYDAGLLERLAFIRESQLAGLTLAEITSVLELKDAGSRSCEHTAALVRRHLADLDERIDSLVAMRSRLADLSERAAALDPVACTDPHRCQVIEDRRPDHHSHHGHAHA